MHVVYASDEANARAVGVSAHSLVRHNPSVRITVLADRWSLASKEFVSRVSGTGAVELKDIYPEDLPPGQAHISSATFIRLLIPEILRESSTCLYIDADTMIRKNISEISKSLLRGQSTAGVRDSVVPKVGCSTGIFAEHRRDVNPHADYINAGVLLMDLERWRLEKIGRRALDWIRLNPGAWGDNDAICATLNGNVALLHHRFNATQHMMRRTSQVYGFEDSVEVDEARRDPAVVHYTGAVKPWHSNASMPFLEEWRAVAAELGWTRFRHSFTVRRRIERRLIRWIDSQA